MFEWYASPLLTALGFLLGYFYTRTMRLADKLPEDYVTKEDCRGRRQECRHGLDLERGEFRERMERIESKLDRLTERLLQAAGGR